MTEMTKEDASHIRYSSEAASCILYSSPDQYQCMDWKGIAEWEDILGYIPPYDPIWLERYSRTPAWWRQKRYPFLTPWWRTSSTPPEITPEQADPTRDFCYEQVGFSEMTVGRRILLRSQRQGKEGMFDVTSDHQGEIARETKIGLVLSMGDACYPESQVYGPLPFCQVGDWVVFSNWERGESLKETCFYCNDLHIVSILDPKSWPEILRGYE